MIQKGCLAGLLGLSPLQARAAWHAARDVALADGEPSPRSRDLLAIVARALAVTPDAPRADPAEAFPGEEARRGLLDALVVAACIEGDVSRAREVTVLGYAKRLGVRSHWAELLPSLRMRHAFAVKRALARRSPDARRLFRRTWEEEGVLGALHVLVFLLGLHRDAELAARFRALATLPEGSFGRAVADHFRTRGLTFPGEKSGIPERMMHHDLMHVVNGYDTDAAGECELAGFYAGCADGDAFTFVVTVLATFHLGLPVSPSQVVPARGAFDPERVLAAFVRGRSMRVDVMGRWDYWELMPLPTGEVRARLGLDSASS